MTSKIIADTLEQRRALAVTVLRIKPEELTTHERNLAMALLREKPVMVDQGVVYTQREGDWAVFAPLTNWEDYGDIVSNQELVVGSHARYDDESDSEKVTGHWYSAHAYFGGTTTEGCDLREVVSETCAKLLNHNVEYAESWQVSSETDDA